MVYRLSRIVMDKAKSLVSAYNLDPNEARVNEDE